MASALKPGSHAVHLMIPFGSPWLAAATMINARCVTCFLNVHAVVDRRHLRYDLAGCHPITKAHGGTHLLGQKPEY